MMRTTAEVDALNTNFEGVRRDRRDEKASAR